MNATPITTDPTTATSAQTWFCADCGGTDIRHDAIVQYNPVSQSMEVLEVLDDPWCETCMEADPRGENRGDCRFGTQSPRDTSCTPIQG